MNHEEAKARQALIAETIACLAYGWNVRKIGEAGGSAVLVDESRHDRPYGVPTYNWIYLCDNGGEFNVGKINHEGPTTSVPYEEFGGKLDGGTMAYRVFCAIRGEAIDYSFKCSEIIEDARKAA